MNRIASCVECGREMVARGQKVRPGFKAPGSRGYCSGCYERVRIANERYTARAKEPTLPVVSIETDATVRAWVAAKFPGDTRLLNMIGLAS